MPPPDWARSLGRRLRFQLPDEHDELCERYEFDGKSDQLRAVLRDAEESGARQVLIEAPYVDFDYRAEYSQMYSREFNPPSDKCERLLFFAEEEEFLGFAVMRPGPKPVGRTGVQPRPQAAAMACCLARHSVRPNGSEYAVAAYPFMSQDGQYGRCAHAAIWSIARYHHLRWKTGRHSIAAVVDAAGTREAVDRTTTSGGLRLTQVAEAFSRLGLPPLMYDPKALPRVNGGPQASGGQESVGSVVCRYLNSGFPVALNTHAHLSVLTGYGYQGEDVAFLRADDNVEPYEIVRNWADDDRLGEWEMLLVPLPARIHVPGEYAEQRARYVANKESRSAAETLPFRQYLVDGRVRLRTYAVEGAEYKLRLAKREPRLPDATIGHHQSIPLSAWIWVTEFHLKDLPPHEPAIVLGEVVIDATSHRLNPRPLLASLGDSCFAWLPDEDIPRSKHFSGDGQWGSALPMKPIVEG
jgi:hypothetical protein